MERAHLRTDLTSPLLTSRTHSAKLNEFPRFGGRKRRFFTDHLETEVNFYLLCCQGVSLLEQSVAFYKNQDDSSLLKVLKPFAILSFTTFKACPHLSEKYGSQLHEFAKEIEQGLPCWRCRSDTGVIVCSPSNLPFVQLCQAELSTKVRMDSSQFCTKTS